jgi:hypothetical protein
MAEAILYRCRGRVSAVQIVNEQFRDWLADVREAAAPDLAGEVQGWISECLTHQKYLEELRDEVVRLDQAQRLRDLPAIGELMLQGFERTIRLLSDVLEFLKSQSLLLGEDLEKSLARLRKDRSAFRLRWPTNPKLWEQASQDISTGRVYSPQEASRELQRRRAGSNPG